MTGKSGKGRNPTRRNRKIGQKWHGRSRDNTMGIPSKWSSPRVFYEELNDPVFSTLSIQKHEITLVVEPTLKDYYYACTPEDVERLLMDADLDHLQEIDLLVFHQPKRKEELMASCWGRFVYWANLGRYEGSAIYLTATSKGLSHKRELSQGPEGQKELERLMADGHEVKKGKREIEIHSPPEAVRTTQLFRTIPHELGHCVDWLTNCLIPVESSSSEEEADYIEKMFWSKPFNDKEAFAHRYAREFLGNRKAQGKDNFGKVFEESALRDRGLEPTWFTP